MADPYSRRGFLRASIVATAGALVARVGEAEEPAAQAPLTPAAPPEGAVAPSGAGWTEALDVEAVVNGALARCSVGPDESALELVRDRLGLTGSKRACGHGACGACTIRVDGAPVASCLLPATALQGRQVQTVEGLAAAGAGDEGLHPVQRAFLAEDGLQCGYCTPGFVVESVAFYERWRAEHGDREPSREEVAGALAGHLCRCGAYDGIYRAVQGACAGRYEASGPDAARVDGREKVTGKACYTVDVKLPGQLEARILRAWSAPMLVTALDLEPARAMAGVKAVIPLIKVGARVRYPGQEIAAVAATDAAIAAAALRAIQVGFQPEASVVGLDAALAEGAPLVYADKDARKGAPSGSEGPVFGNKWSGNVRGPVAAHFFAKPGQAVVELEKLEKSGQGTLVRERYRTQTQVHTALEPHAAVAQWTSPSALTVYLSTQAVEWAATDIAERYRLRPEDIRVLAPYVGGGFGAKATLDKTAVIAIDLARKAGAPVRVANDRAEEIAVGGNRPGHDLDITIGADASGALLGIRGNSYGSGGVSVGNSAMLLLRIMYDTPNKELYDYDVVSHGPPAKPMRGPGGPQALFGLEQTVDAMAHARGEDPVTLRRRWDPNPVRAKLYDAVEQLPLWRDRGAVNAGSGRHRRGVGLAVGSWPYFTEPATQVSLEIDSDGRLVAATACQDMGQGSRSVLAHVIAERFGVATRDVVLRFGDSAEVHGPMSGGSRTTASIAAAADDAADQLIARLLDAAEDMGLVSPVAGAGGVDHGGGHSTWAELAKHAGKPRVIGRRLKDEGGNFLPFKIAGLAVGRGAGVGVTVVEVDVDTKLGLVRPRSVWAGFGVGRRVVPTLAESQARGGVIQGLSYALYEQLHQDRRDGALLSVGLEDYRIIGISDVPPIALHWEDSGFEHTRVGGIGLGEIVTIGVAAATGNAVFHATGWRPPELPLTPDRVLKGVRA